VTGDGRDRYDVPRALGLALAAALVIALVRGPLAATHHRLKESSDVYTLPPERELIVLSLGYRSALADLLWAHVLVSQGLHNEAQRRFGNLIPLLRAINGLEPTYRDPYLFADALITFQANETPRDEVLAAREIMERGMANRPLDADLWLAAGEFVGFVAPGTYLTDPAEQARWRVEGARMLAHAAELSGDNASIGWQALGGASLLSRAGERDAAIRFLRRSLAVTDDPELKQKLEAHLGKLLADARDDVFHRLDVGIRAVHGRDLPQIKRRSEYVVLGPPRDPAYCAGAMHAGEAACAASWQEWEERSEEEARRAAGPLDPSTPRDDGGRAPKPPGGR
jgi:hypothetical protein